MSLSTGQLGKYWRRWNGKRDYTLPIVTRVNHWVMVDGRLHPEAAASADRSEAHAVVWSCADGLARTAHRAITPDDLRHAAMLVATTGVPGRPPARAVTSVKAMENWSFSRLLCLFGDERRKTGLLIEPLCVESMLCWQDPARDTSHWLEDALEESAPEARLIAICRNAFHHISWRDLDADRKRWLLREVRGEQKRWHKPVEAMAGIEQPY